MTHKEFESAIGYHCSPVLMGLKPSNLVSFSKEKMPQLPDYLGFYAERLRDEGICMEVICGCRKHYLVLVYRPALLESYLARPEVQKLLEREGYPLGASLDELLSCLKKRFEVRREFPHEIGAFLGYPMEDVEGFCRHKGSGSKMCGYWKVYGDVEKAQRMFDQFDRCREFITGRLECGYSIVQLVGMKHLCTNQQSYY